MLYNCISHPVTANKWPLIIIRFEEEEREGEEEEQRVRVGEHVVKLARTLDDVALLCCVLLGDSPPTNQARLGLSSMERDITRRAAAMGSSNTHGHGLQFDIDRLFSTRIKVFDYKSLSPSMDSIISTIIKASLKACQEMIRSLPPLSLSTHTQLEVDLAFIKQITGCLIRESNETDALHEQVMLSMLSRCIHPDEGPEVSHLSRAVAEGFFTGSRQCILSTGPFQRRSG
mmetsp:Transcript_40414/g.41229  ORF Transcript_40414/g.41229 Transcript_40414/m.41229 type:complete len:230 (-) Transcript_40414:31-720(-)